MNNNLQCIVRCVLEENTINMAIGTNVKLPVVVRDGGVVAVLILYSALIRSGKGNRVKTLGLRFDNCRYTNARYKFICVTCKSLSNSRIL